MKTKRPETIVELEQQDVECAQECASVEAARDEKRAALLIEESGDAFIAAVDEAWGEKIDAAKVLLAEAERLLDQAEASSDEGERRRLLQLFEVCMGAAEART